MPGSTGVFRDSDDDSGGVLIQEDELLKKPTMFREHFFGEFLDFCDHCCDLEAVILSKNAYGLQIRSGKEPSGFRSNFSGKVSVAGAFALPVFAHGNKHFKDLLDCNRIDP